MTVTGKWFNDEHIIWLTTLYGVWTWDEVWATILQSKQMIHDEGIEYKVDAIIDLTYSAPIPPLGTLTQGKRLADFGDSITGIRVYVQPNRIMKAIAKTFWLFYADSAEKFPFEFADTVAEAYSILTRHRDEWA